MSSRKTALLSLLILLVAAGVVALIFLSEPEAQRGGATKETAMLVEVEEVARGTFEPTVTAMGTVEAARDVVLAPRVTGEIVERSPRFEPGGFVERGEVLVRIDPADFRIVLEQRKSDLRQALSELQLEEGRQDVARKDYQLLEETLGTENEDLVLRRPQLESARARVESARAAVAQAELDLERTAIRAPFDAHVLSRDVDLGSQVSAGQRLGRLVGTETYWVMTSVPRSKLRFLEVPVPGAKDTGSRVQVRDRAAWPEGVHRAGRVEQLLGELAERTRMARVLVTVDDPLAREANAAPDEEIPPLVIGAFVEARIEGEAIEDVVRVSRDHVRTGDTVWVMEDDELRIRDVEIVYRDADWAYVREGLEEGDRVVTTHLSTVVEGAPLRTEGTPEAEGAPE